MYHKFTTNQLVFDFYLPFGGKLNPENRWVIQSTRIPWGEIEDIYKDQLSGSGQGCEATSGRVAFGALLIQERLGITDRETVAQIIENPYLQFFLGYKGYTDERPFHHTMMVHFRKRFSKEILAEINTRIVDNALEQEGDRQEGGDSEAPSGETQPENNGKLMIDATCTPADIPYPTDLGLLNEAREKTEAIIDCLHEPHIGQKKKPRTYRQQARKAYLKLVKQRKPGKGQIRKAIRKQLGYIARNHRTIDRLVSADGGLLLLGRRLYKLLLVSREVHRQQQWMYEHRSHHIPDRIVNLYQPHVRPIVRGKAGRPVEFGAKISVGLIDGFSTVDRLSWDAYNESVDLQFQIESYRDRFGCYPESVHVDKIYRTIENRRYCQRHNIRLSGPALGRPPKGIYANKEHLKKLKRQQRQDEKDRQAIEGKFGQGKRRFTLSRIMARLAETSEAVIMVSFIVMNLEKILRDLFLFLFFRLQVHFKVNWAPLQAWSTLGVTLEILRNANGLKRYGATGGA